MAADAQGTDTAESPIEALRHMLRSVQANRPDRAIDMGAIAVADRPGPPASGYPAEVFPQPVIDLRDDEPRAYLPSPPGPFAPAASPAARPVTFGAVFPSVHQPDIIMFAAPLAPVDEPSAPPHEVAAEVPVPVDEVPVRLADVPALVDVVPAPPALGSIALLPVVGVCRCGLRHEVQRTRPPVDRSGTRKLLLLGGLAVAATVATFIGFSARRSGPPTRLAPDRVEFEIVQLPPAPAAEVLGK